MKIGRNDPCHCGSGKKYKKCHLDMDSSSVPAEVFEHVHRMQMEDQALRDRGIYINHVNPVIFRNRKVWAIGSTVYYDRSPKETFHEFIIFILLNALKQEWFDDHKSKVSDQ